MKTFMLSLCLITMGVQWSFAQNSPADQEIIKFSKEKWQWMADKKIDILAAAFYSDLRDLTGFISAAFIDCAPTASKAIATASNPANANIHQVMPIW
ncbi:hypothetical protein SAMN05661044_01533 [Olivibacter domesticus]|uniref:Uncharacterized protein n=1 Tax=Olivibacter domesticus TaxID=407022 RepID=A0A1H7L1V1_OLID1|nr:hypothetical protein SAMN05661044_01533 [Olivibacter domesticus]